MSEDSIVYKYLSAGRFVNDVSLDHYATLSCKPGWDLAYTILAPLKKLTKNEPCSDYSDEEGKHIFCVPSTTREFAKITMTIKLGRKEKIKIICPHGVVGLIRVRKIKEKKNREKESVEADGIQVEFPLCNLA